MPAARHYVRTLNESKGGQASSFRTGVKNEKRVYCLTNYRAVVNEGWTCESGKPRNQRVIATLERHPHRARLSITLGPFSLSFHTLTHATFLQTFKVSPLFPGRCWEHLACGTVIVFLGVSRRHPATSPAFESATSLTLLFVALSHQLTTMASTTNTTTSGGSQSNPPACILNPFLTLHLPSCRHQYIYLTS